MKRWIKTFAVAGIVALWSTACDDLGTEPSALDVEAIRAEAALVAADGMFQDLSLVQDPGLESVGFPGIAGGPDLVGDPLLSGGQGGQGGQCQRTGFGGAFRCGQMVRDGFIFEREVTFFDAEGNEQPEGFDAATTDAIHLVVSAEGTRERSYWIATMKRSRDMWLTELLTDAHHLNGEGHSEVYRSGNPQDGVERTFDMTVDVHWDDVVHLQPRSEHPYPESGSITREIFVEVTKDGEVVGGKDVTTVITFNGTQYVTMTVDGEEIEIDLAQREVRGRWWWGGGLHRGG
jgi:hypothetical protein